jgi:hypothetical protein
VKAASAFGKMPKFRFCLSSDFDRGAEVNEIPETPLKRLVGVRLIAGCLREFIYFMYKNMVNLWQAIYRLRVQLA